MGFELVDAELPEDVQILPWITTWSRLEVHPTTEQLEDGLRARVADPLWLLHRQRAFLELNGEDAGSPIDVRLGGTRGTVTRFHAGPPPANAAERAVDVDVSSQPLETVVEREDTGTHARHAAAAGAHLKRVLAAAGVGSASFADELVLSIDEPTNAAADQNGAQWRAVLDGVAIDGAAVAAAVRPLALNDGTVGELPAGLTVDPADRDAALGALATWLAWYEDALGTPAGTLAADGPGVPAGASASWVPNRQEYAFALAADLGDGEVVLSSEQYVDGDLDWYDFVATDHPSLGEPATPGPVEPVRPSATIPTPVRYSGMPADRYWEFEDTVVNLGGLATGPGDLGRMLLAEFGLVYSNDWFVVPLELPVGSIFKVDSLTARDTFGVDTEIPPSFNRKGAPWEMFELSAATDRDADSLQELFFLPPVVPRRFESEPIEEVRILRDEMANLVWGVERKVPGASGQAYDRALESTTAAARQQITGDPGDTQLVYRLQTPVPEHWIPFAPVAAGSVASADFDIRLQRRAMLKTPVDGGAVQQLHPRGRILRTDLAQDPGDEPPLELEDEEAAREGVVVRRSFQYTRWVDGSVHSWVGRSKHTGRGEGSSGLRFDTSDKH